MRLAASTRDDLRLRRHHGQVVGKATTGQNGVKTCGQCEVLGGDAGGISAFVPVVVGTGCRFPFKLSLLTFQLALVTLSMCQRASRCPRRIPTLLCQAATLKRLSRIARWPAGGDSLNGSNARFSPLKGPKTRDGQAPPEGRCEEVLVAERP